MIELELLQRKFEKTHCDTEVFQVLSDCDDMLQNDGNKKAVTAYLQMTIHFYGKDRIMAVIENYGFERLKKYVA